MADFDKGWPVWREHEGRRFTAHPWDPGGATKFGITLRSAQAAKGIDFDVDDDGDVDARDVELLDEPTAIAFYRQWWNRYAYARITDQQIATKVMDLSINMGPRGVAQSGRIFGAHALVQRAVNACGYRLVEDGILGPVTIRTMNECESRELILELCFHQAEHYRRWLSGFTKIPGDREVARAGLMRRARWPFAAVDGYTRGVA
jgi:lysozyme family protein